MVASFFFARSFYTHSNKLYSFYKAIFTLCNLQLLLMLNSKFCWMLLKAFWDWRPLSRDYDEIIFSTIFHWFALLEVWLYGLYFSWRKGNARIGKSSWLTFSAKECLLSQLSACLYCTSLLGILQLMLMAVDIFADQLMCPISTKVSYKNGLYSVQSPSSSMLK